MRVWRREWCVCVVGAMVGGGGGEVMGVGVGEGGRLEEVGEGGEGRKGWRGVSCLLSCPPVGWLWASVGLCWMSGKGEGGEGGACGEAGGGGREGGGGKEGWVGVVCWCGVFFLCPLCVLCVCVVEWV